jgi:hypothetical protein
MRLSYLLLGMVLFAIGGMLIALASYEGDALACVTGILAFLLGALSVVAASPRTRFSQAEEHSATVWDAAAAPRLGEMLVSSGTISEKELQRALARQRTSDMRLGELLVEMGLVTHSRMAEVLKEQVYRRTWEAGNGPHAGMAQQPKKRSA